MINRLSFFTLNKAKKFTLINYKQLTSNIGEVLQLIH
ncbi:MAG: hypothetical protein ACI910_002026 [Oleispira sp.]|jgi:hypothetical protein